MTTRIFVYNATSGIVKLTDSDKRNYGTVSGGNTYSMKLNFSNTYEKEYTLTAIDNSYRVLFWIGLHGEISRVETSPDSSPVKLQIGNQGGTSISVLPLNLIKIVPNNDKIGYATAPLMPKTPITLLHSR